MLRKRDKTTEPAQESQQIDTLIGIHSIITGELSFEGTVRIDGQFQGNIQSLKGGTLIVSEGAKIIGDVNAPSLILHGSIEGNVYSSELLKVGATGELNGDLEYTVMSLAEGSSLNGRCNRINEKDAQTDSASKPTNTTKDTSDLEEI